MNVSGSPTKNDVAWCWSCSYKHIWLLKNQCITCSSTTVSRVDDSYSFIYSKLYVMK